MARLARTSSAALVGFAVVLAASGWLYAIRPHSRVPGPVIGDALPLDELSKRSAVPFAVFLAVWGTAALLLGLVARAARVERLTAALLLALGVGFWGYLSEGTALLIVRQIPAEAAFHVAAGLKAVYLPAALAGLAGALAGMPRRAARPRAPLVLAWFVAAAGGLGLVDEVVPEHRDTLLAQWTPQGIHPIATALSVPLSLALLVVARGLARRKRRAWQIGVVLLAGSTVLHFLHSFDYGAAATGIIALALVARHGDFDAAGDPDSQPRVLAQALLFTLAIYAYGAAALWVNRLMADQRYSLGFALRETTAALLGLTLRGSAHLSGAFGDWFPLSVLLAGITAGGLLLHAWLSPWRYRLRQEARERELARNLVDAWGADTLAPFVLRADKSYFFSEDERAFLAYKVVGGVAIVSGDPVGPPGVFRGLVGRFIEFAHARDWRIAVLGASSRLLDLYRAQGLHALYHGDEAVIDVASFSLEGRPIRKVRQSVHRLERAGYRGQIVHPREIERELRGQLEAIARSWRAGEPERGFVMALDALFRLEDQDAVFVIGRRPDGAPAGFLHFACCRAGNALSLSSMPRLATTPNGFNEWLVCEAVAWAAAEGFERVSLNFAPFAALLAPEAHLSVLQRVEKQALLALKGRFQLDNLLHFNRKFFPQWERRFVVYERRLDLPRIGLAALAAEAYLPLSGRRRQ